MPQNSSFSKQIAIMQEHLPKIAKWLLALIYLASAASITLLNGENMATKFQPEIAYTLSAIIGIAGQSTVALVVFFSLLNPNKPPLSINFSYFISMALTCYVTYEIAHQVYSTGLGTSVALTLGGIRVFGGILEIMYLREIHELLLDETFEDAKAVERYEHYYHTKQKTKEIIKQITQGNYNTTAPTPSQQQSASNTIIYTPAEMMAIAAAHNITQDQMEAIRLAKVNNEPEAEILKLIDGYSTLNQYNAKNKQTAASMNQVNGTGGGGGNNTQVPFSLNFLGNGHGHP